MRRRSQEVLQVVARTTGLAFPPVICVQQLSVTLSHEFGSLSPHSAFSVLRVVLFTLVPTLFACRGLWFNSQPMNEVENELSTISPDLLRLAQQRNSTALLLDELPRRFLPQVIAEVGPPQRTWELTGLVHLHAGRPHETLGIFSALYQRMLVSQLLGDHRVHKGMPLVWIRDAHVNLDHAKMPSGAKVRFRPILRVPTTGWCGLAYRIANSDDMPLFSGNGLKPSQKRPCFQKHYFNVSTTIG